MPTVQIKTFEVMEYKFRPQTYYLPGKNYIITTECLVLGKDPNLTGHIEKLNIVDEADLVALGFTINNLT